MPEKKYHGFSNFLELCVIAFIMCVMTWLLLGFAWAALTQ